MSPLDKLEKLLHDTLQKVGGEFHPSDPAAARERFLASRRRRRLYAFAEAGAAVGMAALAVIFIAQANLGSETKFETASEQPRVVATIDTTANPVAVAIGEGAVWMTDSENASIKRLDPTTNREIGGLALTTEGEPDEILAGLGFVWVSDTDGAVHRIDPATGSGGAAALADPAAVNVRLDLALTTTHLWALDPSTGIAYLMDPNAPPDEFTTPFTAEGYTDIASDGRNVWAYSAEAGSIQHINPPVSASQGFDSAETVISAPIGDENSDLAVGFGAAWISTGAEGKVYRIDIETHDRIAAEIGGRYADLSIDITDDAVWALAIDDDAGTSELFELDSETAEVVSDPLQLPGVASDMSVGEGSVWVPDEGGLVRRISSEVVSPPTPDESAEVVAELPDDQLLYVFVRDDDLWARYVGEDVQLTDTFELESAPTVNADGSKVAFVRRVDADAQPDIYELDLDGGEPIRAEVGGTEPAYGPNGELAWLVPPGGILPSNDAIALMPWVSFRIGDREPQSFEVFEDWQEGLQVTELTWDQTGTQLYIDTHYEGTTVQTIDIEIDDRGTVQLEHAEVIPVIRDGTLFVAPSVGSTLNVIQTCCSTIDSDLPDKSVLAEVRLDDYAVGEIVDLSTLDLDETLDLQLASMGTIWFEDGEWIPGDTASWLVGDGLSLWLVDSEGDYVELDAGTEFAATFAASSSLL